MRAKHPKPEIESALRYAEDHGFEVLDGIGHWGIVRCPSRDPDDWCPKPLYVWSTPKNAGNHAKQIRRYVDRCPHQ